MISMIGKITESWANSIGLPCIYISPIKSTNSYAKELSQIPNERFLILTDEQTQGRGRNSNTWQQENPGHALLSSWCFQIEKFPQATITCRVGLAIYESLKKMWPDIQWSIKAPNDIYIGEKKAAGILVELIQTDASYLLIIGIGLNVLSSPLAVDRATSLFQNNNNSFLEKTWHQFLSQFYFRLQSLFTHASELLSDIERAQLLEALNQFPMLKEKYIDLEPNGTLKTLTKTILWSEL